MRSNNIEETISQTSTSAANAARSNEKPLNKGCLLFFCLILVITCFITDSGILLFFCIIGITIIVLALSAPSPKSTPASTNHEKADKFSIDIEISCNNIDKTYFNSIHNYGEKLIHFYEEIYTDYRIHEQLNISVRLSDENPIPIDTQTQITFLLTADIFKVYQKLGYDINLDEKESFGLIYILSRIFGLKSVTYETFPFVYDLMKEDLLDYLPSLEKVNRDNSDSGFLFLLGPIFGNVNEDLEQKYYSLLYRYASLVAKADGIVNEEESNFLKSIMQLRKKQ